jgi:predicted Zn-dependent protease
VAGGLLGYQSLRPTPAAGPDAPDARRVNDLLAAGRLDEAAAAADRLRAARPDDLDAHLLYVEVSLRRDHLPGAIDGAREALRLRPDAGGLREQLAVWLFLVGRTAEADEECRRCRADRPADPRLAVLHADTCRRLGDNARAEQILDALPAGGPPNPAVQFLRGALYLDADRPEQAEPLLREAAGRPGEHQQRARYYLSLALARTGREDEARRVAADLRHQQTVEIWAKYGRPDSPAYRVSLAEALIRAGRGAEAVPLLDGVLAKAPDDPAAHRLLAEYHAARGDPARAADHRRRAGD